MSYMALKHLHLMCVALTFLSFSIRGIGMLMQARWLEQRWVRIAPHIIDTLLLLSAIGLVITLQQYPFVQGWLTAKVLGLIAYIGLGTFALRGKTPTIRLTCFGLALLTFAYIVGVALTRSPLPGL